MRAWRLDVQALALVLLFGWVAQSPARCDSGPLAELNERWTGARCRIRLNVPIKKGRDGEGWSRSQWIVPRTEGMGLGGALLSVSDRDAVSSQIFVTPAPIPSMRGAPPRGKAHQGVPRGTPFIAEGWEYQEPEKQTGLVLNLRFARIPARARIVFRGKRGGELNRKAVGNAERWARIELFELKAADEALVDVPSTTAPAVPVSRMPQSPPAGEPAPQPPGPREGAVLELRVLGVTAAPLRVIPGGEIALVVTYSLAGVPATQALEILERRQILHDGELLTTLEARSLRQPGTHESSQPVQIPASLAAGVYEVRATVEGPGAAAAGSAIFQVIAEN